MFTFSLSVAQSYCGIWLCKTSQELSLIYIAPVITIKPYIPTARAWTTIMEMLISLLSLAANFIQAARCRMAPKCLLDSFLLSFSFFFDTINPLLFCPFFPQHFKLLQRWGGHKGSYLIERLIFLPCGDLNTHRLQE